MSQLHPISAFDTEANFRSTARRLNEMVMDGELFDCGLDPDELSYVINVYRAENGDVWLLAHPDEAFRGYLRCKPGFRTALEPPK